VDNAVTPLTTPVDNADLKIGVIMSLRLPKRADHDP